MQLSFEIPPALLHTLGKYNDYNFTLAHMVPNEEYTSYYRESTKYTICDNSNFELGSPLPASEVVKAAQIFHAQEIIAPDVFGSGSGTIASTEAFIKYLEESGNLGKFKVHGVVQGANIPDWTLCLDYMKNNPHVDVIGFSYMGCNGFSNDITNSRIVAAQTAINDGLTKTIHLLGIGSNPKEIEIQKAHPNIRSCDTSIPIVEGLLNIRLSKEFGFIGQKHSRPSNYFDIKEVTPDQLKAIIFNINIMKDWLK